MNTQLVTTGLIPLTVNSIEKFELAAWKDGVPWDLTGGSATLKIADPSGNVTNYTATISGTSASYVWTVPNTPGDWKRAWDVQDAAGVRQVSRAIPFTVVSSPV